MKKGVIRVRSGTIGKVRELRVEIIAKQNVVIGTRGMVMMGGGVYSADRSERGAHI